MQYYSISCEGLLEKAEEVKIRDRRGGGSLLLFSALVLAVMNNLNTALKEKTLKNVQMQYSEELQRFKKPHQRLEYLFFKIGHFQYHLPCGCTTRTSHG